MKNLIIFHFSASLSTLHRLIKTKTSKYIAEKTETVSRLCKTSFFLLRLSAKNSFRLRKKSWGHFHFPGAFCCVSTFYRHQKVGCFRFQFCFTFVSGALKNDAACEQKKSKFWDSNQKNYWKQWIAAWKWFHDVTLSPSQPSACAFKMLQPYCLAKKFVNNVHCRGSSFEWVKEQISLNFYCRRLGSCLRELALYISVSLRRRRLLSFHC